MINHVINVLHVKKLRSYMLCRCSKLTLANGEIVDLPKLVPSFSSKGFPFIKGKKLSEVSYVLENTGPTIEDSFLVSAYDIHFDHIKDPSTYFGNQEMVIIDSGGYELSSGYDSTESVQFPYKPKDGYDIDSYIKVLSKIDITDPIIMTNFDYSAKGDSIKDQIISAQTLFNKFPGLTHDFIVKPTGSKTYLDSDEIISCIRKMQKFHILGFTEKELGGNLLDRMIKIAEIRHALNGKSLNTPIHIWGGLDPLVSILYFLVGAEIFDGISWLKYGYHEGYAITRDSFTSAKNKIHESQSKSESRRLGSNISYLYDLQIQLTNFVKSGGTDFSIFKNKNIEKPLEQAFHIISAKLNYI